MADSVPPAALPVDAIKRLLPWLVAIAFFMQALDTTIVNTAVPAIAAALQIPPLSMKAVLSSYPLSVAVFVPVSGWLADRYGTRRVFSTALAVFSAGSLLCGLASDIHMLVAFRVLQGIGGAMMVPVGRLTMVRTFPRSELVRAMSFVAIPMLIGPMLGPVVGGLLVHYLHWRLIFLINVPIGLLGLLLVYRHLPDYRKDDTPPLDWVGLVLFSSGVALLSYVLEIFGEHTLSNYAMLALTAISMVLLTTYVRYAGTIAYPLLRLTLFRIRTFSVAVAGIFATRLGASGVPFLLPLLYQVGLGYTPVQSALLILPQPIAAMGLKMTVPKILTRFGYRRVLVWNTVAMGVIMMLFSTIGQGTPEWRMLLQAFFFGFCSSLQYSSMNTLVYADVSNSDASMASTMASASQQLSMSFGVATASLVAALFIPARIHADAGQMLHGVQLAFIVVGALTIVAAAVFSVLRENDGNMISQHQKDQKELPVAKVEG